MHSHSRRRRHFGPAALLLLAACSGTPEMVIRVQGTVHVVGIVKTPIPNAAVTVEWPAQLGGGQSALKTNAQGHFAIGRTRRVPKTACAGLAITVLAPNFASAYTRHTGDCGDGTLTFDFSLLPQVH